MHERVIAADRIGCINPGCRRTVSREKYPHSREIVCGKCWKLIPKSLTARYRALRKRSKRLRWLLNRRIANGQIGHECTQAEAMMGVQLFRNWSDIHNYFNAPAAPAGLENFLKEIGLDAEI